MKKISILLAACLIFALSGCQSKAPVNPNAKNGNGTPAINLPNSSEQAAITKEPAAQVSNPPTDEELMLPDNTGDIIEIKEKMFIAQTNDIYFNPEDYLGKTIKYEGIFSVYEVPETGAVYYSVFRYGPGCCGVDANAGFEVIWDKEYPKPDDWVEAVGVLEEYDEDGYTYLRLALSSLTVLETRGAEYVSQ